MSRRWAGAPIATVGVFAAVSCIRLVAGASAAASPFTLATANPRKRRLQNCEPRQHGGVLIRPPYRASRSGPAADFPAVALHKIRDLFGRQFPALPGTNKKLFEVINFLCPLETSISGQPKFLRPSPLATQPSLSLTPPPPPPAPTATSNYRRASGCRKW